MNNVSVITKPDFITFMKYYVGVKELDMLRKESPERLTFEEIHCGRQVFYYIHDDETKATLDIDLDWIDKLFKIENVIVAIRCKGISKIKPKGTLVMINCRGETIDSKGFNTINDTRFKNLKLRGDNSIGYSILKGESSIYSSEITTTLLNSPENIIDRCEINYSQFNGEFVKLTNQKIADTSVNGDRGTLLKRLMMVNNY